MEQLGFTPEQLAERRSGLGASEIAAVAGLNPWKSAIDVWLEKTGRAEPQPMSERAELGHIIEPAVATWYARRVGALAIEKPLTLRHPTEPWLFATPDLFADFGDRPRRICEIKLVGFRLRARWFIGDQLFVPDEVVSQVLIQCAVSGHRAADVCAWFGLGPNEQFVIECPWLPQVAEDLLEVARTFWFENVLKDQPPAPDSSDSFSKYIKEKFPKNLSPLTLAPADADHWAEQFLEAKDEIANAEKRQAEAENWLKRWIADTEGIERPGSWVATWKANSKGVPKWRDIAQELGASAELIAKHISKPARVFRCERAEF